MCTEKIIFMAGNTHEYVAKEGNCDLFCSRAPHGARGLKPVRYHKSDNYRSRAPHGARGLKLVLRRKNKCLKRSRPARGAWIETTKARLPLCAA